MPRGRKINIQNSNLTVIKTNNVEGNIPYMLIDDEYGIACDAYNEILVKKIIANKTVESHIEQYIKWDAVGYYNSMSSCLKGYMEKTERDKKVKLVNASFADIINIKNNIIKQINKLDFNELKIESINKIGKLSQSLQDMERQADIISNKLEQLNKDIEKKNAKILKV